MWRRDRKQVIRDRMRALGAAAAFIFIVLNVSFVTDAVADIVTDTLRIPIGESTITLLAHRSEAPGLTYLNLHDDENTAVDAALTVVEERGGMVYELRHDGRRNLAFELDGLVFTVDPNRIFTPRGIRDSLERFGSWTAGAQVAVASFAATLLYEIGFEDLDVVVTIHNNTDEAYSALSYVSGGRYAEDAELTSVETGADPDDFFFVTSPQLFEMLKAARTNVVLQDNSNVRDDGSLSVLAARDGRPYVNAEAEHGHTEIQVGMLELLHELLLPKGSDE